MPARHLLRAPLDHVAHQPHRRVDGKTPLLLGDVLLEDVRLDRPAETFGADAPALGRHHVEREHDRRRRVDRHRDGHLVEWDPGEQRLHVRQRVDRHALPAHFPQRTRVVGIVAHQRGHVERRREARLTVFEQVAEPPVGLPGIAEPGELTHRPQPAAIHRLVHATGVGKRSRTAQGDRRIRRQVRLGVQRLHRITGERGEQGVTLRGGAIADGHRGSVRPRTSPLDAPGTAPQVLQPRPVAAAQRARAASQHDAADPAGERGAGEREARLDAGAQAVEAQDVPASFPRDAQQVPVGVDDHGVADELEHREVGLGVRVGVALGQVDSLPGGELDDRLGLFGAVDEQPLRAAGVHPVLDARRTASRSRRRTPAPGRASQPARAAAAVTM